MTSWFIADVKKVEKSEKEEAMRASLTVRRALTGRKSTQEVKVWLCGAFSTAVTKNAPTALSIALTASSFADYPAFSGLYDEVTMLKGECFFNVDMSGTTPTTTITGCYAYDAIDLSPSSGFTDLVNYRHKFGPFIVPISAISAATGTSYPIATMSHTGLYHFAFAPPRAGRKGIDARPTVQQSLVTPINTWLPVGTASLNFGNIKGYLTSPTSAAAGTSGMVVRVLVAFRSRNG